MGNTEEYSLWKLVLAVSEVWLLQMSHFTSCHHIASALTLVRESAPSQNLKMFHEAWAIAPSVFWLVKS